MKPLRPAFVLTFSAVAAACGTPTRNPPGPLGSVTSPQDTGSTGALPSATATTATSPATGTVVSTPALAEGTVLNARDAEDRVVFRSRQGCYVELPFPEPPKAVVPPPRKDIACPSAMASDPAWTNCMGGEISVAKAGPPPSCKCFVSGNPPPPQREVACPADVASHAGP